LTDLRRWLSMTWSDNRAFVATATAAVLAVIALGVSVGSFGGPQAAAGFPPTIQGARESFQPGSPDGPTGPGGSLEPEPEPEPSDTTPPPEVSGTPGPSFEPVPTTETSPEPS
jgi:hypothetical protein